VQYPFRGIKLTIRGNANGYESGTILKSDIEISRKDAKPQRSGEWLRVIDCMHFANNFTSFTFPVNSFSVNFQDRLGGIPALRDAKSGFRTIHLLAYRKPVIYHLHIESSSKGSFQ
jgi:hypothetical protein